MKKQKKIDLLTDFQLYLYNKGKIYDTDWDFEKQAKKFVKKLARQKRLEDLIEADGPANGGIKSAFLQTPEGLIDLMNLNSEEQVRVSDYYTGVVNGKGRRLYSKCNRGDVIRSYVEESNLNKGFYVLVIQCRNGKKFIVAGDHYAPTYLQPYDQSSDTKKADNEK